MATRSELGRYACYHCGHDQWSHNLAVGCPHCKCMATPGEAGLDPSGRHADLRIRAPHEPPLHEWQRRDDPPATTIEAVRRELHLAVQQEQVAQERVTKIYERLADLLVQERKERGA